MKKKKRKNISELEVGFKKTHLEGTLVDFVFANVGRLNGEELKAATDLFIMLHNSGEIDALCENQWISFEVINKHDFFMVQHFFCETLPKLSGSHQRMMLVVKKLVQLGGEDLAANQPNSSFIEWCQEDLSRALDVISDARIEDNLALDHLTFALIAGAYFDFAKEFLKGDISLGRICAATSLGRMEISVEQVPEAVDVLIDAFGKCDDPILAVNLFSAAFSIFEKSDGVDLKKLKEIVIAGSAFQSPSLQYQAACALYDTAAKLDIDCVDAIAAFFKKVEPEHEGILHKIDLAIPKLIDSGYLEVVFNLLEDMTIGSSGKISISSFVGFFRKISSDGDILSELSARWLTEGNYCVCSGFAKLLNEETRIEISKDDLPLEPDDITYMCRKAVGYLFMKPIAAASVLLSVIKHINQKSSRVAVELLFDPLLINYGGKIREYLENFCIDAAEPENTIVQSILDKKKKYLADFAGIEALLELQPSEVHRHAEQVRLNETMRLEYKKAEKQSSLLNMVSKSYLLYGRSSLTFVETEDGTYRQVDMTMKQHSIEIEYPRMEIMDSVGLQYQLVSFRLEGRGKP